MIVCNARIVRVVLFSWRILNDVTECVNTDCIEETLRDQRNGQQERETYGTVVAVVSGVSNAVLFVALAATADAVSASAANLADPGR